MTTPSGPEGGRSDPGLSAITGERHHLINLALAFEVTGDRIERI